MCYSQQKTCARMPVCGVEKEIVLSLLSTGISIVN